MNFYLQEKLGFLKTGEHHTLKIRIRIDRLQIIK